MATAAPSAIRRTVLMCVAETLSMTGFACYTTLLPVLLKAWGLSNSEAGLIGGVFYAGYMFAVPLLTTLTECIVLSVSDRRRTGWHLYAGAQSINRQS